MTKLGEPFEMHFMQHATIFSLYFTASVAGVLMTMPDSYFPANIDYFGLAIAYFGQAVIFYSHTMGKTFIDIYIHNLLVIVTLITLFSCLLEVLCKSSPLAALLRPFFKFVMGTWFIQIAFIIDNPFPGAVKWKAMDHEETMLVTSLFCYHLMGACCVFTLLFRIYAKKYIS